MSVCNVHPCKGPPQTDPPDKTPAQVEVEVEVAGQTGREEEGEEEEAACRPMLAVRGEGRRERIKGRR
jgi:hypothetical protein